MSSIGISLWRLKKPANALRSAPAETVFTYPALYNAELKAPIAAYAGVQEEHIVTGCGSDDVIDCALRAFAEPGGVVAHASPTFSMVPSYARANGMTPVGVPLGGSDYTVDADALDHRRHGARVGRLSHLRIRREVEIGQAGGRKGRSLSRSGGSQTYTYVPRIPRVSSTR